MDNLGKESGEGLTEEDELALKQMEALNAMLENDGKALLTFNAPSDRPQTPVPKEYDHNEIISEETSLTEDQVNESRVMHEWTEVLGSWDVSMRKRMKYVTELAHKGIPDVLRGHAWQKAADHAKANRNKFLLVKVATTTEDPNDYPELLSMTTEHEKQIKRDIARTFPDHDLFKSKEGLGQETLYNVIKAYSCYDTEVGYCQGSPFIVAMLLMHMPEEDAFRTFSILMRDFKLRVALCIFILVYQGLFRPSMADLPLRFYQFDKLFKEIYPELHAHFADMMVEVSSFASQWFLTLFGVVLPLSCAFRILDVFLIDPTQHGVSTIFRVGLAILGKDHDLLLMSKVEVIMEHLSRKGLTNRYEDKADELMAEVVKLSSTVTSKKITKYEREYHAMKQAQDKTEEESAKIKKQNSGLVDENTELKKKLANMEREIEMLAKKLLEKSVELNNTQDCLENAQSSLKRKLDDEEEAKRTAPKHADASTQTCLGISEGIPVLA